MPVDSLNEHHCEQSSVDSLEIPSLPKNIVDRVPSGNEGGEQQPHPAFEKEEQLEPLSGLQVAKGKVGHTLSTQVPSETP